MTTTIPQLKQQFLAGQVRILNAPLDPPDEWRDAAPKTGPGGNLSDRVVDEVLAKANRILRTHNATCFPPMVLAHVAAQIDALYWSQTTTAAVLEGAVEETREDAVPLDADLCDESTISTLPATIPTDTDTESQSQSHSQSQSQSHRSVLESDDLATRYVRLRRSLQQLAAQRKAAEERRAQARVLLDLLAPLRDARANVQGNLVVADGELVAELRRLGELLRGVRRVR